MNVRQALGTGGLAGIACAACCAPLIIAALGVTLGLAAVAGLIAGIAAAIAVAILGFGYIGSRRRRARQRVCAPESEPVVITAPARRGAS